MVHVHEVGETQAPALGGCGAVDNKTHALATCDTGLCGAQDVHGLEWKGGEAEEEGAGVEEGERRGEQAGVEEGEWRREG
jgi:hypothetical protein